MGLTAYFWIDTDQIGYAAAQDLAFTKIKAALDRRGIEIPFPIRTVLMQQPQA